MRANWKEILFLQCLINQWTLRPHTNSALSIDNISCMLLLHFAHVLPSLLPPVVVLEPETSFIAQSEVELQ